MSTVPAASQIKVSTVDGILDTETELWSDWLTETAIFNQPEFFRALEESGSATNETGWQPQHLSLVQEGRLVAVMPMYIKNHSYGEYMFDWQWVNALHRAGLQYYPKAVCSIPFTPVTGPRLITDKPNDQYQGAIIKHIQQLNVSNFQCLYVSADEAELWRAAGAMIRRGYQFTWHNASYGDFTDFLASLRSKHRKKIRRERRMIQHSKLTFKRFYGKEIPADVWQFLLVCYQRTYLKRSGHEGYLNETFFALIRQSIPENILVVMAYYDGEPIASSLCFVAGNALYGRYWGTLHDIDGLHFEVCYYQGIEFCIEYGLASYHPGTQGDYKRRRGFVPEYTYGAYYFENANIATAIADYLKYETAELRKQMADWQSSSPYVKGSTT